MKKFLMLLAAVTMLSTGTVQAFPGHGGAHFRPGPVYSYHRPGAVRHKHHRSGTALAVAGTIVGMAALANLLTPQQTVQTYVPVQTAVVPQPVATSNCTTTVNNGVTVQQLSLIHISEPTRRDTQSRMPWLRIHTDGRMSWSY